MKQKPSKENALDNIYLVKAHTKNQGRLYLPASLIGKRVMLQEVELPTRQIVRITSLGKKRHMSKLLEYPPEV